MATAKGKRRVPPSRARYEATHKTVSARLDPELQRRLDLLKQESDMSVADIIRIGLDKAEPAVKAAYDRGVEHGIDITREKYEVPYQCAACGEWHLSISTLEEKLVAGEFMTEQGWHAEACE
jgi:hypothetical protein